MRTRRALILLPSSGQIITKTAVGSGCAITVDFPSDGSPVLRSSRRPLRFSAAFDPVGGRRPRRSSCMPPRRWVVERTFSWLSQNHRTSKDYERLCIIGEAFIYVAMSRLMVRRLARS